MPDVSYDNAPGEACACANYADMLILGQKDPKARHGAAREVSLALVILPTAATPSKILPVGGPLTLGGHPPWL